MMTRCRVGAVAAFAVIIAASDLQAGEMQLLNEKYVKAGGYGATSVSFSPDGRVLASDNGNSKILPPNQRQSLAWYSNWHLQLWDVESGRMIDQSKAIPSRHTSSSLQFLKDGQRIVSANGMTGGREIRIWSVADGVRDLSYRNPKVIGEHGIAAARLTTSDQLVTRLAMSPDGLSLSATGSYGFARDSTILKIWSVDGSSRRYIRHQAHQFYINDLCWSPDGNAVVLLLPYYEKAREVPGGRVGGHAGKGIVLIVRDAKDPEKLLFEQRFPDVPSQAAGLTPIPGTSWIAFPGPEDTMIVFDLSDYQEEYRLKGVPSVLNRTLAISRDGSLLAAGGESVVIWNLPTREVFARSRIAKNVVYDLEFSPDGSKLAIAGHHLYLWDLPRVKQAGVE